MADTYVLRLPDGSTVDVPLDMPARVAFERAREKFPDAFPAPVAAPTREPSRAPMSDFGGSLVSGIGGLLKLPGQVGGLIVGAPSNWATAPGEAVQEYGRSMQSEGFKQQQGKIAEALKEADKQGFGEQVKVALTQYLSNPYALANLAVEQIPNFVASWGAGTAAQIGAKMATPVLSKAAAAGIGAAGAQGFSAVQQGADVGAETFERVKREALAAGMTPEQAQQAAAAEARQAGLLGAGVSLATMRLIPGSAESALFKPGVGGVARSVARGIPGEAAQEFLEEGSGALLENIGASTVTPGTDLLAGVGTRGTVGGLLGGIMGGGAGAISGMQQSSLQKRVEAAKAAREAEQQQRAEAEQAAKAEALAREEAAKPENLQALIGERDALKAKQTALLTQKKEIGKPGDGDFEKKAALAQINEQLKEVSEGFKALEPRFAMVAQPLAALQQKAKDEAHQKYVAKLHEDVLAVRGLEAQLEALNADTTKSKLQRAKERKDIQNQIKEKTKNQKFVSPEEMKAAEYRADEITFTKAVGPEAAAEVQDALKDAKDARSVQVAIFNASPEAQAAFRTAPPPGIDANVYSEAKAGLEALQRLQEQQPEQDVEPVAEQTPVEQPQPQEPVQAVPGGATTQESMLRGIGHDAADAEKRAQLEQIAANREPPPFYASAMQDAFGRAVDKPAPAAPVQVPEPRVVPRFEGMRPMSRAGAEAEAARTSGEVVRVQNQSGKFAYAVLPNKAADTDIVAPDGAPFTLPAATQRAKAINGAVVRVPGGYAVRPAAAKFSEGASSAPTVEQARTDIGDLLRPNSLVTVVQSVADLPFPAPEKAQGAAHEGRIYLVADNLKGERLPRAVLMHELGVHVGLSPQQALVGRLTEQVQRFAQEGDALAERALERAEQSSSEDKSEEPLAYFIEEAVASGIDPRDAKPTTPLGQFFKLFTNIARTAMRNYRLNEDKATAQDLVDFAYGAAKKAVRGAEGGVKFSEAPAERVSQIDPAKFERVEVSERYPEDDGYLYHVTSAPSADSILKNGFKKSRPMFTAGVYPAYSKGKVFFTERSGVPFWSSRVEDALFDAHDDPPDVAVVRIKREDVPGLQPDEVGSRDASHPSYAAKFSETSRMRGPGLYSALIDAVDSVGMKAAPAQVAPEGDKGGVSSPAAQVEPGTGEVPMFSESATLSPTNAKFLAGKPVTSPYATPWDKAKSVTPLRARVALTDYTSGFKAAMEAAKASGKNVDLIQVFHILMQASNAKNLTGWRVEHGTLDMVEVDDGGVKRKKVEGKKGVSLRDVGEALGKIKGWGTWDQVSEAFQRLNMGLLARTRGEEVVFGKEHNAETRAAMRAMASEYLANPKASPFYEAMEKYKAYNRADIDFLLATGQLTEGEHKWLASHNYIPLFRAEGGKYVMDVGRRKITVMEMKSPMELKRLLGGDQPVMNWFAATRMNTEYLTKLGLQNHAAYASVKALESVGLAKNVTKRIDEETGKAMGGKPVSASRSDVVTVRNKGVVERYQIDSESVGVPTDLTMKAFEGIPAGLPGMVRLMGGMARVLRTAVTANPVYLAKQVVRDPMSAWGLTGAKFNPITATIKGIADALSGNLDDTLKKAGVTGTQMFPDSEIGSTLELQEIMTGKRGFKTLLRFADTMAHEADAITRVNVMKGAKAAGATQLQAELAAYESMPFMKRGASTSVQYLTVMIPFMNATIQGIDALYRAAKGDMPLKDRVNIRAKLAQRAAVLAGLTGLYFAMVADDEGYKELTDQQRIMNWYIPGINLKVPVPFEFGFLAKALPEIALRTMTGKATGEEAFRDIKNGMWMLTPGMIPHGAKQAFEILTNHSFFYEGPIESKGDLGKTIEARRKVETPTLAKALSFSFEIGGEEYGLSERKAQYLADSLLPNVIPALSALIDLVLPPPDIEKPTKPLVEQPYFNQLFTKEANQGEVARFYDEAERLAKFVGSLNFYQKNRPEKVQEFVEENRTNIVLGKAAGQMRAAMNKIDAEINQTVNSKMPGAEKRERMTELRKRKSELAAQFRMQLRGMREQTAGQ